MTDILDEILAATESVRSQQQQQQIISPVCAPAPTPTPSSYLPPPTFAPSPRGVQDDLAAFNLLQYPKKPSPNTAATAAAAVAASTTQPPASTTNTPPNPPSAQTSSEPHTSLSLPTTTTSSSSHLYQDTPYQPQQNTAWSSKRTYHTMEQSSLLDYPGAPLRAPELHHQPSSKKTKTEPSAVVMPPSAKSILERREKAIREGRRKDAKLTESERRILRRLRNRESAERCRLRRVQQAVQLERKIESMQVENDRLVAVADEYEKTIQRLERVIKTFTDSAKSQH